VTLKDTTGETASRSFTVTYQPSIEIDNDIVHAKIDTDRACVTSLVFKKGSNQELIKPQGGRYLIDLGVDPRLGSYLKTGWQLDSTDEQPNYWKLSFRHPSGFANEMVLSWTEDHVEVSADVTAYESIETYPNFWPGGGCEQNRDKWAFPTESDVQIGSFSYPGGSAQSIYPSDSSWGTPTEGWIAFWDEQVDEVYGFTFSSGVQARIWNGVAANPQILFPAGTSHIDFHVVKPKPTVAYEAIRELTSGPYLVLTKEVDRLFAGAGNELTYILTPNNMGNTEVTGVVIEDVLPSSLEFVEGSISNGGIYDSATRRIRWDIGSLAVGAEADTVTFKARVTQETADGTQIVNTARIWATEQPIATTASAVTTVGVPSIAGISPDKGGNGFKPSMGILPPSSVSAFVTVSIFGRYLDPNAEVKLTKAGQADITAISVTGLSNGSRLTATFDLTRKIPGIWNLVVTNPDNSSATLPNAFTIEEGGEPKLWIEIVGLDQIRVGREQTFWIRVGNSGNVDIPYIIIHISLPNNPKIKLSLSESFYLSTENVNWKEVDKPKVWKERKVFQLFCVSLKPGEACAQQYKLKVEDIISPFDIVIEAAPLSYTQFIDYQKKWAEEIRKLVLENIEVVNDEVQKYANSSKDWWNHWKVGLNLMLGFPINEYQQKGYPLESESFHKKHSKFLYGGIEGDIVEEECVEEECELLRDLFERKRKLGKALILSKSVVITLQLTGVTKPSIVPGFPPPSKGETDLIGECIKDCYNLAEQLANEYGKKSHTPVGAIDPNDKAGPCGFDREGTPLNQRKHFIPTNRSLSYTVFFENLDTADAAAQEVLISDQLDVNLDWSTFALNTIQIGEKTVSVPDGTQNFTTEVDLRPTLSTVVEVNCEFNSSTGIATWLFRGKNPYTGELSDFLPPNTEDVAPQGEGWVSYTVKPKPNLPTGTVIRNKATIDFEVDIPPEPMETPEVFNTIDAEAPTSSVNPLAEYQWSPNFKVSWSGKDDEGGSGIKDYTIYVADNGGPYTPWLANTTETSATFTGTPGHTYSFYSVARDNVGNTESLPDTFDAQTNVLSFRYQVLAKQDNDISLPDGTRIFIPKDA
ncbi:MAG: DUF11 domain-containing protein, partial [Patescibacteria group bacterium]|nr:DUF11 domain-containing protein [Patescibacteria group bacterium]